MSDATGGSSVVRSSDPSTKGAFDLSNEIGTLQLLRAIHQSTLEPDVKNKLRDTVFAFRAEKDAMITAELATLFAEHNFVLLGAPEKEAVEVAQQAPKQEEKPVAVSRLGMARKKPQFAPASVAETAAPVKTETVPEPTVQEIPKEPVAEAKLAPEPEKPVEPTPAPAREPVSVPVTSAQAAPKPEPETPTPAPEPVQAQTQEVQPDLAAKAAEQPVTLPEAQEPASAVKETLTVEQTKQPEPAAAPQAASPVTERIKEIKHEVNEMVGNPVNLIDVHNEVGREYMNALLDAMKKSAGAPKGEQEAAMQRLEAAFAAVQETMGVHIRNQDGDAPIEKKESTVPKESVPESEKAAETPVPVKSDFASAQAVVSEETVIKQNTVAKEKEAAATDVSEPAPVVPEENAGLPSVAKEKQVQEMMVAQKREAATTDQQRKEAEIAAMDPLMTPEVTAGLGQLLSEWGIFKHSGLFGTGPSGMDHPLYKKLSIVPMAAVVAGRFEGVTPQIKRSITDYMNGWRYEEGIMHEQGEAFETYLRRVIKHVLDKRK